MYQVVAFLTYQKKFVVFSFCDADLAWSQFLTWQSDKISKVALFRDDKLLAQYIPSS